MAHLEGTLEIVTTQDEMQLVLFLASQCLRPETKVTIGFVTFLTAM
jgi:hypothetical protein